MLGACVYERKINSVSFLLFSFFYIIITIIIIAAIINIISIIIMPLKSTAFKSKGKGKAKASAGGVVCFFLPIPLLFALFR